jgi:guanylate kinase
MQNYIIVLAGFSGAGKDALTKYISENYNYSMVISHTSRPMRPNESECNPYYFISRNQFEQMIKNDDFIECRKYNTLMNNVSDIWYYGVHKDSIDLSKHSYIVVLDMLGLKEFKKHFGDNVMSFFIDVNEPERKRRAMSSRKDFDLTEWDRRYADDMKQFPEEMIKKEVDYIVPNYEFYNCVNAIIDKTNKKL